MTQPIQTSIQTMIHTKKLTKTYGGKTVVNRLGLDIPKGSIYGFLGPNGVGKSTTMKMLLGLTAADGGTIRIEERSKNLEDIYLGMVKETGL